MSTLDLCIIIIIAISFIYGACKGAISIISPIISFIAAIFISPIVHNFLIKHISIYKDNIIYKIIIFILIYVIIRIIISKIEKQLKKILNMIFLGWLDRILGGIFSVLIVSFIMTFIVFVVFIMSDYNIAKVYNSSILLYLYNIFKHSLSFLAN